MPFGQQPTETLGELRASASPRRSGRIEKAVLIKTPEGVVNLKELNMYLSKGYRLNYMLTSEIALLQKDT